MTVLDSHYQQAQTALEHTLARLKGCTKQEQAELQQQFRELEDMQRKLSAGRVEIVVFGEISTGKSALINALIGREVTAVNVQGGWTKQIGHNSWESAGYVVPGFEDSQVVLIDTPGLNEVGGGDRAVMAADAARSADLILFVCDSDLNEIEFNALLALKAVNKPLIFVLNKLDLYSRAEQARLIEILRDQRLRQIVEPSDFVCTKAQPREMERVIEAADGSTRQEWFKPAAEVAELKSRILEVLQRDGLALLALNAAMYAADHSDRIAALRMKLREQQANTVIWSYASVKALAVGCNPLAVADVLGGAAADVLMVGTLAKIYGLEMSWTHARSLVASIVQATGWTLLAVTSMHYASSAFKLLTAGWGTVLTAIPQGAAAGYGAYIVGQAAKFYFEHGSSWGVEGPKAVVQRILAESDRDSVLARLKAEIEQKIIWNRHSQSSRSS
jgi:small GTP-binding protein